MNNKIQNKFEAKNFFENHPKKTMLVILFFIFFGLIFGFEKYIAWKNPALGLDGKKRHIVLREHAPFKNIYIFPDDRMLKQTDSLLRKKYRYKVDKNGFLYPSKIHDKPDLSVFFLGGSTTECLYVDEEKRFPYLAGRFLEKENYKVNTYNGGVSGNSSMHSINTLINKIIPLDPDVVVMMHAWNDLIVLLYEKSYWNSNPTRGLIVEEEKPTLFGIIKMLNKCFIPNLYKLIKNTIVSKIVVPGDEFSHIRKKKININNELLIKKYQQSLQLYVDICKSSGTIPVLMTQANRVKEKPDDFIKKYMGYLNNFGIEYSEYRATYETFNETIRNVAKINDIPLIDLALEIPQEKEYMFDVNHYNQTGSELAAKIIARELSKILDQ